MQGQREVEVLEATVAVLTAVGYDRLTMDQVAQEAKASKATSIGAGPTGPTSSSTRSAGPGLPHPDIGSLRGDLLGPACGPHGQTVELPMSVPGGLLTA